MHPWISDRAESFDSSGIRRVFDLAAKLKDPINLSIGQPDFDVPDEVKKAAIQAIEAGYGEYSDSQEALIDELGSCARKRRENGRAGAAGRGEPGSAAHLL